jgi:hypothetical protein
VLLGDIDGVVGQRAIVAAAARAGGSHCRSISYGEEMGIDRAEGAGKEAGSRVGIGIVVVFGEEKRTRKRAEKSLIALISRRSINLYSGGVSRWKCRIVVY